MNTRHNGLLIGTKWFAIALAALLFQFAAHFASAATTVTFNTAGTTNWTCPAGVTSIFQVECWGGGGAGGLAKGVATSASDNSGGGGGGAYARRNSVPVTPGTSYTITIPAQAVSAGVTGGSVNGSDVTFTGDSGVQVKAAGGKGGINIIQTVNATTQSSGGAGALTSACVGDAGALFAGGNGANGTLGALYSQDNSSGAGGGGAGNAAAGGNGVTGTGSGSTPGTGGSAGGGNGGAGRIGAQTNAGPGGDGGSCGGGGGGAKAVGTTQQLGGKGGLGQIILTYIVRPSNTKANNTVDLNLTSSWTVSVPTPTDVATWYDTVVGANTTVLGADLTFGGIAIANPGGLVTINGPNTLTLGDAAIDIDMSGATVDLTLNCPLALGAPNVWDVTSGRTLTLGGAVSGSYPVTKQGAGKAIFSVANAYSGGTTVSAGVLDISNLGALGGGTVSVSGSQLVVEELTGTLANNLTLSGTTASGPYTGAGALMFHNDGQTATLSGTVTLAADTQIGHYSAGGTTIFNNPIGGTGALTFWAGGAATTHNQTWVLKGGASTYNGNTTLTSPFAANAIVQLNGGTLPSGTVLTLKDGNASSKKNDAVFDLNGNNQTLAGLTDTAASGGGGRFVMNSSATLATLTVNNRAAYTYAGVIGLNNSSGTGQAAGSGAIALVKSGAGTLTLSGASTYTGATTINAGTVQIGVTGFVNPITISNYGFETPTISGYQTAPSGASWTFTGNSGIDHNSGTWYATTIGHEGVQAAFIQQQAGTISQSITAGTAGFYQISFQAEARGGAYGPEGIIVQVEGVAVGNWPASALSQSAWQNYSCLAYLTAGSHTLTFLGNNTLGGDKSVAFDNVHMDQPASYGTLPSTTAVNLTASGATLDLNGTPQTIGSLAGVAGSSVINGNLSAGGDDTSTIFAGVFSGGGYLTKTGAGTLTLSGANTYSGATTINAGTLRLGADNTLNTANNVVLAGGALHMGGYNNALGTLAVTGSGTIVLGSGSLSFLDTSALAWPGSLTLVGTLGPRTLRFGNSSDGLTSVQLEKISLGESVVSIDAEGYLVSGPGGTVILVR